MTKADILIIEPDALLSKLYRSYLERKGYNVVVCYSGQSGIDVMDTFRPSVIVLELQLKANNGYEFLYELRSYQDWQAIPLIINSLVPYNPVEFSLNLTAELGVKHYLYKPNTSLESLEYYIDRSISNARV